ncbi:DedA family protein [Adhaeribacter aquaticus]|uniref:DedA family protein n=1 Tax=Adhaeribacter aquaticus TaxID=299567 RepID=UPI000418BE42|nr:VTT domain-containing protein [Adhaeribacter aquaticus]
MNNYCLLLAVPNPEELIRYGGLLLISAIVFIETGLLLGLIIPGGDSLLFTTGLLSATGVLETDIYLLIPLLIVAGISGDLLGYFLGSKMGHKLYHKPDSWYFKRKYLEKAEIFYQEKGKLAIIAGKFIPIVRTLNPLLCGIGKLSLRTYVFFTSIGSFLWISSLVIIGYLTGIKFPGLKNYIHFIIPGIILVSVIPLILQYFKHQKPEKT